MAFQVSPGVLVKEKDLTNVIPAAATTIGAIAGQFSQGPIDEVTSISTYTRMDNYDGFMEIDDLQLDRILSQDKANDIRFYLDKNDKIKKQLVSQDGDYLVAIVQPFDSIEMVGFVSEVKAIADSLLIG